MNRKHLTLILLCFLTLGWTGCSEDSFEDGSSNKLAGVYNARLVAQFHIQTEGLDMDTPLSRTNAGGTEFADMWYAVFDAATGTSVPSATGEKMRHKALTGNQPDPIEEQLPGGTYQVVFLVMAAGGDVNAVQPVESRNDAWIKAAADGTVAGDFFHGSGTVTIKPEETTTLAVDMNRISGLLSVTTEMAEESQKELLSQTELLLDQALPYGAMTADGKLLAAPDTNLPSINITDKGGAFFALASSEQPVSCKGQLVVTLSNEHQRLYPSDNLSLERGKRTAHTLNLNLPFNRLGYSDQSSITGERRRLFAADATVEEITNKSFSLAYPLKVVFNANNTATVQFFSLQGIGRTEIYARIKTTKDYFKVLELDTIRPLDDITIESSLLNNEEGYYWGENGRIIKIPAGINLSNNEIEYKVVCHSPYWKNQLATIKLNPGIQFDFLSMTGFEVVPFTPRQARTVTGMMLNWGVMFASPHFETILDQWPEPDAVYEVPGTNRAGKHERLWWTSQANNEQFFVTKEELLDKLHRIFGQESTIHIGTFKTGGAMGFASVPGASYRHYAMRNEIWDSLFMFTPYQNNDFVVYHELVHLLDYPDSYDTPTWTTMAPTENVGWPEICTMLHTYLCNRNELPFSSPQVLDDLDF